MYCRSCNIPSEAVDGKCVYCGVPFVGQHTGAAAADGSTSDTSQAAQPATATPASVVTPSSGYTTTSWDDLELLYPPLWIPWAAGKLINPSQTPDSNTRKLQLASVVKQLDNTVNACTKIPAATKANWIVFRNNFADWFIKESTFLSSSDNDEQMKAYQNQIRSWQLEIGKYCDIGMPVLPEGDPSLSALGHEVLHTAEDYFATLRFAITVAALGGIALLVFSPRARSAAVKLL